MPILDQIQSPADVKALTDAECTELAAEIRARLLKVVSRNGGHIGPNLGVVELTIALHRAFNTPEDKFVFDVSHQGYVHKMLTGRNGEAFEKLRRAEGLSGFLNRSESEHDAFGAGHAGTALSAALGMAAARDIRRGREHVVAVCGDAAFTCGITLEALNNIASTTKRLIVILNDNEWSIAKNVGALSNYFNELITNPIYKRLNSDVEKVLNKMPGGESLIEFGSKWKRETKDFLVPSSLFEKFKLRYIGPIDGHDIDQLEHYLDFARKHEKPILLHVLTKKGKGYDVAIDNPERFHGASPFDVNTGKTVPAPKADTPPKYQDVVGRTLVTLGKDDRTLVGVTAAMPSGTGLNILQKELPRQFYDVGIAEEHAAVFAAGMATNGMHPVCAIYSTFLQRAYDPVIHDICLQNLPVLFCMDRAGLSPNDGATHHGLFDIAYLRCVPNAILMAPSDEDALADMIATGVEYPGPAFIRYPRGNGEGVRMKPKPAVIPLGKAVRLESGHDLEIWSYGTMLSTAREVAALLEEAGYSVGLVDARFAKPLDTVALKESSEHAPVIATLEDHVISGGFGSAVLEACSKEQLDCRVIRVGWPDRFIEHGDSVAQLRKANGLDPKRIAGNLRGAIGAPREVPDSYVAK